MEENKSRKNTHWLDEEKKVLFNAVYDAVKSTPKGVVLKDLFRKLKEDKTFLPDRTVASIATFYSIFKRTLEYDQMWKKRESEVVAGEHPIESQRIEIVDVGALAEQRYEEGTQLAVTKEGLKVKRDDMTFHDPHLSKDKSVSEKLLDMMLETMSPEQQIAFLKDKYLEALSKQ